MKNALTTLIILFSSTIYAQSLKGYTIGEELKNRCCKFKTTVAEIEGTMEVQTTDDNKIKMIEFISSNECTLSELQELAILVGDKYQIPLVKKPEIKNPSNPYDGLIALKKGYSFTKDNIRYLVSHYFNSYYRFSITDISAINKEKSIKLELEKKKQQLEKKKKLKDF